MWIIRLTLPECEYGAADLRLTRSGAAARRIALETQQGQGDVGCGTEGNAEGSERNDFQDDLQHGMSSS